MLYLSAADQTATARNTLQARTEASEGTGKTSLSIQQSHAGTCIMASYDLLTTILFAICVKLVLSTMMYLEALQHTVQNRAAQIRSSGSLVTRASFGQACSSCMPAGSHANAHWFQDSRRQIWH